MRRHTNGTHSRTASTVRNTESLVEVEVANVSANVAGTRHTNHGVHIGAVHVDLAPILVHNLADRRNSLFKHTVR